MLHRIFLAIKLQKGMKEQLLAYREKWPELPARWAKQENLHLTLAFYGNASDQELEEIKQKVREVASKHKPFSLQQELAVALERVEEREFSLHLTLARFNEWEFKKINPEERPEVNEDISFEITVHSVDIMESKPRRGGAEYSVVESCKLSAGRRIENS